MSGPPSVPKGVSKSDRLRCPVTVVEGIGPARAAKLERLGVRTVRDLLLLSPRELDEWSAPVPIAALASRTDVDQRIAGRIVRTSFRFGGRRGRSLLRAVVADDSGELEVAFFNQPWLRERFTKGLAIDLRGRFGGTKGTFVAARFGLDDAPLPAPGTLVPLYPSTEGLGQELVRGSIARALDAYAVELTEPLAPEVLARADLPPLPRAVLALHRPTERREFERAARRVALEPVLVLQARLAARRAAVREATAPVLALSAAERVRCEAALPFELTRGQRACLAEILDDLARGVPMRRLLQGDVGSGKTALGLFACIVAARSGAQGAFLAPTELLAEQHAAGLAEWVRRAGLRTALVTGSLPRRERRALEADLARGAIDLVFGTHALLSEGARFARLGVCVVDEQHRFGVHQRERLIAKGEDAHALFMTATPIPRSLALTYYGDLDVSVLRERPPGRGAIETVWLRGERQRELPPLVRERAAAGERIYWVCPRIEGDPDEEVGSAEARYENLAGSHLAPFGIELVHGRLPADQRAARLERFRRGDVSILVATTVIEVGVDVPEATVMVVEGAERLGLAQLHQLRGRVGRGAKPSYCYLLGRDVAAERLELLEATCDGFELAEADLVQRGMGDLLGARQAGVNFEGLGDPRTGLALLELARELVSSNAGLASEYLAASSDRPLA